LSYESLTSREARQVLRDLPETRPAFFAELTQPSRRRQAPILKDVEVTEEDADPYEDTEEDSEVPLAVLIDRIHNPSQGSHGYKTDDDGRLVPIAEAEQAFVEEAGEISVEQTEAEQGRGKQKKTANTMYSEDAFKWWKG
jgi:hypothetical protein